MNNLKNYLPILFILCLFCIKNIDAQTKHQLNTDISYYADIVTNAARTEHRLRANELLIQSVDSFLNIEESYDVKVNGLKTLYGVDSSFRIMTWQVNIDDVEFNQFGRIQKKDGSWYKLKDNPPIADLLYRKLPANNWYGAIYYDMIPFQYNKKTVYLLCGFDGYSQYNRRKLADILYFDEKGKPNFGLPVFAKEGQDAMRYGQNRLLLTYSLENRVMLQYDENRDMLVYDHLINFDGRYPGQGKTAVPDGSYEAYELKKGVWRYVEKLYSQTQEEPPSDGIERSTSVKKDIFGGGR